jgi:hypothetical protein
VKYYDYNKVRELIAKLQPDEASLGMLEDWWWTAETIYVDGQYKKPLPEGDIIEIDRKAKGELAARLKDVNDGQQRLDIRKEVAAKYGHEISGLCGSCWATPSLHIFKDGTETMYDVYIDDGQKSEQSAPFGGLGCLSGPAQERINAIPRGDASANRPT